jgi:hypothetical protein
MKVDNENDRKEPPEECDNCGESGVELERFYHFGPGHNVDWLCCYCSRDFTQGKDAIVKTIASMLHEFERHMGLK